MAHDGKVTLSTALDNSGFAKGIRKIEGSLGGLKNVTKSLGAAIATAFSVAAVVNFAKESVKAANQLSDALTGLRSILDGQGRSFSDAQKFLEEYTADGLVPMTNAITAYKNLASRGYDDSQIRKVMQALKDASAFGRQASYSMGEAVESATEGLKNENSILVDNAGVTKNVAKMWEEYAASIGTTANNLTQQQKIQAEVNGILEESKYQAGDAAKVAGTLSGQLSQLSVNFNNLKVAVGNALNPILRSLLPSINAAVSAMTRLANAVASVTAALFGSSVNVTAEAAQGIADGYGSAAESAGNLAKSTEAAGKAAKKYLAGFDEITKIGDSSGGSGGGSGGAAAAASPISAATAVTANGEVNDQISPKIQRVVDKIRELIGPLREINFAPARAAFGELGESIEDLGITILDALEWSWFNILVPLSKWSIEEGGPATVKLLAAEFRGLNGYIKPVTEGLKGFLSELEPVFSYIGDYAIDTADDFTAHINRIANVFEKKGPKISGIITNIGTALSVMWAYVEPLITKMREEWAATFEFWSSTTAAEIEVIIDAIYGVSEFLTGVFTGDWKRVWNGAKSVFSGFKSYVVTTLELLRGRFEKIWGQIKSTTKGAANGIIGFVNGMISGLISGINSAITALNKLSVSIPDWVPTVGGKTFGFNIRPVSTPKIPYLAKGAVLPANKPFLAVVGDQRHGTNVEAPLDTIKQALAEVLAMRGEGGTEVDVNITFEGEMSALARILKPYIDKENKRVGANLVKGGAKV